MNGKLHERSCSVHPGTHTVDEDERVREGCGVYIIVLKLLVFAQQSDRKKRRRSKHIKECQARLNKLLLLSARCRAGNGCNNNRLQERVSLKVAYKGCQIPQHGKSRSCQRNVEKSRGLAINLRLSCMGTLRCAIELLRT